ncbi:MAG TPA: class I SAM-dependent methyltransferase [Patescibacteria group bacterium]|nr:class I SAM-dependent methyltransferase [Patescibacteria group bacterium]
MDIIQKTRDDYNKIARHFASTRYDLWPELEQFKPFARDGQQILDWGCGNGRLLLLLKDHNFHYYGVDQSKELLKIAEKKYAPLVKKGIAKFYCTAHKEKNFAANFFDLAFMIASFHHLPDQKSRLKLLKKTFTELKLGGHLVMTVWNLESDWAKEKIKKDWKQMGDNDFLIPWKNPEGKIEAERYYHHFNEEELKGLLTEAGFTIEQMGYNDINIQKDKREGRNLVVVAKKSL